MTNDPMTKKYVLKPGNHQFAPGSPAIHHNNNLSDAEAAWYLEKYPHITKLFVIKPADENIKRKSKATPQDRSESLTPPSGGREAKI
jgi:hypothetical protein